MVSVLSFLRDLLREKNLRDELGGGTPGRRDGTNATWKI
jgi:hypothetical protein